jgi:hypothetical protein
MTCELESGIKYNQVPAVSRKESNIPGENDLIVDRLKQDAMALREALDQKTKQLQEAEDSIMSLQHKVTFQPKLLLSKI